MRCKHAQNNVIQYFHPDKKKGVGIFVVVVNKTDFMIHFSRKATHTYTKMMVSFYRFDHFTATLFFQFYQP